MILKKKKGPPPKLMAYVLHSLCSWAKAHISYWKTVQLHIHVGEENLWGFFHVTMKGKSKYIHIKICLNYSHSLLWVLFTCVMQVYFWAVCSIASLTWLEHCISVSPSWHVEEQLASKHLQLLWMLPSLGGMHNYFQRNSWCIWR